MKLIALLIAISFSAFAVACDDGDEPAAATATRTAPAVQPTSVAPGGQPTGAIPPTREASPPPREVSPTTPAFQGSTDSFGFSASPEPAADPALLVDVRVGAHDGFDRIVFEFMDGQRPSGLVGYKTNVVQCGSGAPVDPAGSHTLAVHFDFTNAHTEAGQPTIPSNTVPGPGNSIIESERTCDFEAVVEWAAGVDGEQPFKVTLLQGPNRVVIDVAH